MGCVGCVEQGGTTRLTPPCLEQGRQLLYNQILAQRRENIVARAENPHRSRVGQRIDDGGATFRMATPLVMDKIAEGSQGSVRKITHDYSPAISIGCGVL